MDLFRLKYLCPVCDSKIKNFNRFPDSILNNLIKYKFSYSIFLFETLSFFNYSCPKCGASDRDRLISIFFKEIFKNDMSKKYRVVDFAPSKSLSIFLKSIKNFEYRSADLFMENVDDKVDLKNLSYKDESFDIFICSHVLEHIDNESRALLELFRVLKKNGFGILMVPIYLGVDKNIDKREYNTAKLRWRHYGQGDHLRLYSRKGFIRSVISAGFKIQEIRIDDFMVNNFDILGIEKGSVLYIVKKG